MVEFEDNRKVTGVILAGGKSRRMGKNKALLQLGNVTLIQHVVHSLQPITDELLLITNNPDEYAHLDITMHDDIVPNAGALGGIHAGLTFASHQEILCVACDNPFLNPNLLSYLLSVLGEYDAVMPYTYKDTLSDNENMQITLQTLCAVYSKRCLPSIEQMFNETNFRVHALQEYANVLTLSPDECKTYDPKGHSFFNVNTPEDFDNAQVIFKTVRDSI